MKKNPILCLLLALAMMLTLTACQINIPGVGTVRINDGSKNDHATDGSPAGNSYDTSLTQLRKHMAEVPDYIFAVAYISSAAGGPDDFELPIQEWVSKAAPELCAQYPFVQNIPRERVVGSGGSLFCVVPRDPNASVAVNRIQWNEKTGGYDNVEVLYRSESGEPFLVFACADMGEAIDPDTEVIVTNSGEEPLKWYPYYGIVALPYDSENERRLAYDFTFYSQEGNDGFGSDIGWTCPSGSQLTQEIWAWDGNTDKPALATLELHANSSQEDYWGTATFTWWYESDFVTPEEVYTGDWGLTGNGEYSGVIMLDLTRTGGKRYTPGETERIIHDGFIVQVPMAFEDYTYLSIDKGQHGSYLPIQIEPDTVIYFYPW